MRLIERKDCPMRHENGNCTAAGGFCTAVNDPICEALHNAFNCGEYSKIEWATMVVAKQTTKHQQKTLEALREIHKKVIESEPVKHGHWERTADGAAWCSACKRKMNPSQYGYAYCGLCGAKMDGNT